MQAARPHGKPQRLLPRLVRPLLLTLIQPGTGEGEIIATLDGNTLSLDFVEFRHDPHKHVADLGTKI